ncbi:MAG: hypothetical protein RL110_1659 [Bacteroidota bacterium]
MPSEPKEIAVFDFDGTLYSRDSLLGFCRYYYQNKPLRLWRIFLQLLAFIRWKLGRINTSEFKHRFLVFLSNDSEQEIERMAENFWKSPRVYNAQVVECLRSCQKSNCYTVVASASPILFILPACKALGIEEVIGTELNFINGRYLLGENCRGDEKLRRIKSRFPESTIREAYSDNFDDLGLLQSAGKGFVVNRGGVVPFKTSGDAH